MKIIHTADLHLFSPMTANLSFDKAKIRNRELFETFERMVDFAKENGVGAFLIAGDMFDSVIVTPSMAEPVMTVIKNAPRIKFFYLTGNHDGGAEIKNTPDNLVIFKNGFNKVRYGDVTVGALGDGGKSDEVLFDESGINILMLHTDIAGDSEFPELKGKNIDYIALGHIHSFSGGALDHRTKYAYCGCPEGRGYDECGEKGFVLIDSDSGRLNFKFIPFSKRVIKEVKIDITGLSDTSEVFSEAKNALATEDCDSMINLVIEGKVKPENAINLSLIEEQFKKRFFAFRVTDKTALYYEASDYIYDDTLKGEFIRHVAASDKYSEEDKLKIIETGLKALSGEALL